MKSARFLAIGLGLLLEPSWSLAQDAPAAARREPAPARNVDFRKLIPSALGTGTISGMCFEDSNGNGLLDAGERGFPGLSLIDGAFRFENLAPGNYVLSESVPSGFTQTFPGSPTGGSRSYSFLLSLGEQKDGLLFLNR